MSGVYPHPIWRVSLNGENLTGRIQPRLMDLSITDNRGLEADELDITLDDSDGMLAIPPRGAVLRVFLGWTDTGLIDKGRYTVDEIEHSGAPDQLTIRARSADVSEKMGEKQERSWHGETVGGIVRKIAAAHELEPVVSPDLADAGVAHIDQTGESDASFLTRLAEQYDAIATVKSGRLLFYKIGRGVSLSGVPLRAARITRRDGDRHRFSYADRETARAVRAQYYDTAGAEKREVVVEAERKKSDTDADESKRVKTLRHVYPNRADAERAAHAALEKIQRGVATFSLTLARGRPDLIADLPAVVAGWKQDIDTVAWLITKISHRLSNSGFTSEVEMEMRG
jgi:phage protein D